MEDIAHFVKAWMDAEGTEPLTKSKAASCYRCLSRRGHGIVCMDFITSLPEPQGYDTIVMMVVRLAKLAPMVPIVGTATALETA